MRTMMKVELDVATASRAVKDGSLPKLFEALMDEVKPEASYFYADHGKRTAEFIFDMKDTSQIPRLAEPFFMTMNAAVDFKPVMNQDDLKKGLTAIEKTPMMKAAFQATEMPLQ